MDLCLGPKSTPSILRASIHFLSNKKCNNFDVIICSSVELCSVLPFSLKISSLDEAGTINRAAAAVKAAKKVAELKCLLVRRYLAIVIAL